jgi:hypothetical protein
MNPADADRYAYAGGDPINNSDPAGNETDLETAVTDACFSAAIGSVVYDALFTAESGGLSVIFDATLACVTAGLLAYDSFTGQGEFDSTINFESNPNDTLGIILHYLGE